jgi:type II secretory ATPase GspE/PulE/Tfp pilus assembly ATPase PilB-like protein
MLAFDEEKQQRKLDELKKQEEEELLQVLAETKYGIPYINLGMTLIESEALRMITETQARELGIAPFKILGKHLHVATLSPSRDEFKAFIAGVEKKGFQPTVYLASHASMEKAWQRYKELSFAEQSRSGGVDISGDTLAEISSKIHNMQDIKGLLEGVVTDKTSHKTSHILEIVLAGAIGLGVSDIHIEPEEDRVRLRYRLDGVLQDIYFFSGDVEKLINSRIKLISGMKLTAKAIAQDGRFAIFISNEEVSVRVSVIPGAFGESIVMRLLNPKSIQVKLDEMGIDQKLFAIIEKEISKPNGLILVTGPTGSGKTTTLYAFLRRIYSDQIKIITIEDPVEYHLEGITQTQTNSEKGYTFLEGLRAALRQDPDVIMVGEIRDDETAKIAVESALTGHIVFSTLHTNNAAGVIPRLIDLGVEAKLLPSALSLSIAQRLLRKLCNECKQPKVLTPEEDGLLRGILKDAKDAGKNIDDYNIDLTKPLGVHEAVGCKVCNFTGYKGRIGIFEAILSDESIEKIVPSNPSEREIKRVARGQGILDMHEDAVVKIVRGITTIEEAQSVVDLEEKI